MKIADSLRQESMPEMVYGLCRLSSGGYKRDELQKLITLEAEDKESQDQFAQVFNFAKECNFISEESSKVKCLLDTKKLNSFKDFRMQVVKGVFENRGTKFYKAAEWFLSQEDNDILTLDSAEKLSSRFVTSLGFNPDKFFALGFRFWMVDLGFAAFQGYRRSAIVFACQDILEQWICESHFQRSKKIAAREFFDKLCAEIGIFETMISNNKLNLSFSMALRILRDTGLIELVYTKDSSDVWHLRESSFEKANMDRFTEVVIKEAN